MWLNCKISVVLFACVIPLVYCLCGRLIPGRQGSVVVLSVTDLFPWQSSKQIKRTLCTCMRVYVRAHVCAKYVVGVLPLLCCRCVTLLCIVNVLPLLCVLYV